MDKRELSSEKFSRRSFLNRSARALGAASVASAAVSYSRILGANDRISLGHIGIGNRGSGLERHRRAAQRQAQRGDDGRL